LRPDPRAARAGAIRSLARAAIATASYNLHGRRAREWPHDPDVDLILRAATSPASMTSAAALGAVTTQFLRSLQPLSAGAQLLDLGIGLSFGSNATISLPNITAIYADWVGELAPIPSRAGTTAATQFVPYKLAVLVSLSNEMIRHTEAEAIVTQVLAESCAPALDASLFSANAGVAGLKPPGLLYGITPSPASTATPAIEAMISDLATLGAAVAPFSGNNGIAYIASAAQAIAVNLRLRPRYPVLATNALPAKTVLCVATPALVSATEPVPQIDSATETLVNEADPAQAIVLPNGGTASPTRSLLQTDSVSLRLRLPITWALRTSGAVAYIQNVNW
jgi:Phage capsid family